MARLRAVVLRHTRIQGLALALVLACALGLTSPTTAAAEAPTPLRYTIEAKLEPGAHSVWARESIRWTNTADCPVHELQFHLYLNAFSRRDTVFFRTTPGAAPRPPTEAGRAGIVISSLRVDGVEVRDKGAFVGDDETQLRIPLEAPCPSGASKRIDIVFRSTLPQFVARAGYAGTFYVVAQWFPKLAKLERDGRWMNFPYSRVGEFYADFADYDVTIRVPPLYTVAGAGERQGERRGSYERRVRFVAQRVHDFAWAASTQFHVLESRSHAPVVRVFYTDGYARAAYAHLEAANFFLRRVEPWLGAYPYSTLTIVVPPRSARRAAGMEYPTFVVTDGAWWVLPGMHAPFPDHVTMHELAHQWFYGLVATNEHLEPWLDEGLSEWLALHMLRMRHGARASAYGFGPLRFDVFEAMSVIASRESHASSSLLPASEYTPIDYVTMVYARPALALETIRRVWGHARFDGALALYSRRFRMRHPSSADLFAVLDEVYWPGFSKRVLRPVLASARPCAVRIDALRVRHEDRGFHSDFHASRTCAADAPTSVSITTHDGARIRYVWPSGTSKFHGTHTSPTPVERVEVDPDRHLAMDMNRADNARGRQTARHPSGVFAFAFFLFYQLVSWWAL